MGSLNCCGGPKKDFRFSIRRALMDNAAAPRALYTAGFHVGPNANVAAAEVAGEPAVTVVKLCALVLRLILGER